MGSTVFPSASSAPTAAEIAAAVAAPSAATIASTVAAPSSATIATAVAAAVPAIGAINTSVANNASPFGGTWTNLGSVNFNGASATISGLGSYKYLRFSIYTYMSNALDSDVYMRINGDSGSNYFYFSSVIEGYNNYSGLQASGSSGNTLFQIGNASLKGAFDFLGTVEISGAQGGSFKTIKGSSMYTETTFSQRTSYSLDATWRNTAGVTSFTVYNSRTSAVAGTIWAQGAN